MINRLREMFKKDYIGWDNRVTKQELLGELSFELTINGDDRPIRNTIAELRKENMLIISNTQFKGYFLTTEKRLRDHPIERKHTDIFIAENINRKNAIQQIINSAVKTTEFIDGLQMKLF